MLIFLCGLCENAISSCTHGKRNYQTVVNKIKAEKLSVNFLKRIFKICPFIVVKPEIAPTYVAKKRCVTFTRTVSYLQCCTIFAK